MQALKKPKEIELISAIGHFDLVHFDQFADVVLWERAGTRTVDGKNWLKLEKDSPDLADLLTNQHGQLDRYLTVNEFFRWRLVSLLRSLRAFYVDIDKNVSQQDVFEALSAAKMPSPSFIVFSGRGLHCYWIHDPMPSKVLPVWQQAQNKLIEVLKPLGADPAARDCTRVLRICGSINSKTGTEVRGVIFDEKPWRFHDLCNEILGYREVTPKAEKKTAQIVDLTAQKAARRPQKEGVKAGQKSIYSRWYLVYQELLKIASWHPGGIPVHHRNNWLFLAAISLSWFANAEALQYELEMLSSRWAPDLDAAGIADALKHPLERARAAARGELRTWLKNGVAIEEDPRFKCSRKYLHSLMGPLIPAEKAHLLRSIVSDEQRAINKKQTDAKRWKTDRAGYLDSLKDSEAQTEPWAALGMSRATYYRRKALGCFTEQLSLSL